MDVTKKNTYKRPVQSTPFDCFLNFKIDFGRADLYLKNHATKSAKKNPQTIKNPLVFQSHMNF